MTVLGAASLMIIGYGGMQVISVFTDTGSAPFVIAGNAPAGQAPRSVRTHLGLSFR